MNTFLLIVIALCAIAQGAFCCLAWLELRRMRTGDGSGLFVLIRALIAERTRPTKRPTL